jgi:hypothetical protein
MKFAELNALYHQPLFDLISQSRAVHLRHWRGEELQPCKSRIAKWASIVVI